MNIESPSNNKEIGQESLNERFPVLKVKEGNGVAGHIQPNIEIQNFDPGVRDIIRFAMLTSQMDSPMPFFRANRTNGCLSNSGIMIRQRICLLSIT
jgi:hypothetical protein